MKRKIPSIVATVAARSLLAAFLVALTFFVWVNIDPWGAANADPVSIGGFLAVAGTLAWGALTGRMGGRPVASRPSLDPHSGIFNEPGTFDGEGRRHD